MSDYENHLKAELCRQGKKITDKSIRCKELHAELRKLHKRLEEMEDEIYELEYHNHRLVRGNLKLKDQLHDRSELIAQLKEQLKDTIVPKV